MAENTQFITLNNGVKMPQLGLGVWQTKDGEEVEQAVTAALNARYRMIDTAAVYANEAGVGRAIARSNVAREDLFVTTKLWNSDQGYDKTLEAFDKSLNLLGLEYIDLYLIHWPVPAQAKFVDTWKALEKLYADKKVRAIGVSNFSIEHLKTLLDSSTITPAVNQVELHPHFQQKELREFCASKGIQVESWSPIGGTGGYLLENKDLAIIAEKHHKSPAQIVIRWHIQQGLVVIPKSVHPERIKQNIDVFDFELDASDLEIINSLHTGERRGPDPEHANFT